MPDVTLVAVGAIACDVILDVPFFPKEDSKLRATSFSKRRGGNVGNTLEVLRQLLDRDVQHGDGPEHNGQHGNALEPKVHLALVAALPSRNSPSIDFISSSFRTASHAARAGTAEQRGMLTSPRCTIDMRHCLYREEYDEPVTSYIISSGENSSRTIVNHNPLPEMSFTEFCAICDTLLHGQEKDSSSTGTNIWFHFEGRIPHTTLQCITHLRAHPRFKLSSNDGVRDSRLRISVELEKPGREGLQELAHEADIVFYSRSWAEGQGYRSAEECLNHQAEIVQSSFSSHFSPETKLLICTWGSKGASALVASRRKNTATQDVIRSPARETEPASIVDTTGAGDTFIAGVLSQFLTQNQPSTDAIVGSSQESRLRVKETLDFANLLAGRKILQHGFGGLGRIKDG